MAGGDFGYLSLGGLTRIRRNGHPSNFDGNVGIGIGTTSPTHKLEVNGTIRAKEIKPEATNWPDFVFSGGHQLLSLEETDAYIKTHGHLPGLKPAAEYEREGVDMLELNQKLLEKVEELMLYTLQQENKIQDQNKDMVENGSRNH